MNRFHGIRLGLFGILVLLSSAGIAADEVFPTSIFETYALTEEGQAKYDSQKATAIDVLPGKTGVLPTVYLKGANGQKENITDPALSSRIKDAVAKLLAGQIASGVQVQGTDILVEGRPILLDWRYDGSQPGNKVIPQPEEQTRMSTTFREKVVQLTSGPLVGSFLKYKNTPLYYGFLLGGAGVTEKALEREISDQIALILRYQAMAVNGERALIPSKGQLALRERGSEDKTIAMRFYYLENGEPRAFKGSDDAYLQAMFSRHLQAYFKDFGSETLAPMATTPSAPRVRIADIMKPQVVERPAPPTGKSEPVSASAYVSSNLPQFAKVRSKLESSHTGFDKLIGRLLESHKVSVLPVSSLTNPKVRVSDPSKILIHDLVAHRAETKEIELAGLGLDYLSETDRAYAFLIGLLQGLDGVSTAAAQNFVMVIVSEFESSSEGARSSIPQEKMRDLLGALLETKEIRRYTRIAQQIGQIEADLANDKDLPAARRDELRRDLNAAAQTALQRKEEAVQARFKMVLSE